MIGLRPTLSRRRGGKPIVLNTAEAVWDARTYSGSGALLDRTGRGHDAQLGSTSGADSNDPKFLPYDGASYLYLPGTASNNFTITLSATTTYNVTITYDDGTTDSVTETSDGSGVLTFGNTMAEFSGKSVASVSILPPGWTFARNDTATFVDENGVVWTVPANVLRDGHYLTDNTSTVRRVTLLERAYTNLVTSDNFDSGWASVGSPTITGGIDDPAGGTGAYTIADTSAAEQQGKSFTVAFTGNAVKTLIFRIRKRSFPSEGHVLQLRQTSGTPANKFLGAITAWGSAEPTVSASTGSVLAIWGEDDYWCVAVQTTSVTAAETHVVSVLPTTATVTQQGSLDVWRISAFNAAVPPRSKLDASEVTTADSFTVALLDATPQEATYLYEGVVLDLSKTGTVRWIWNIGDDTTAGGSSKRLGCYWDASDSRLYVNFSNGSAVKFGYWDVPGIALGDHIVIRVFQGSDGAITASSIINGGAETTLDSAVVTQALPGTWTNNRMGFTSSACNQGLISFKAQSGAEKTLAQMQALTATDIAYYVTGEADGVETDSIPFNSLGAYNAARTAITSNQSRSVTINKSTSGRKATTVERNDFLGAVDDYAEGSITLTGYPFALVWVGRGYASAAADALLALADASAANVMYGIHTDASGNFGMRAQNTTAQDAHETGTKYDDGLFHCVVAVFRSATDRELYIDGVSAATDTNSVTFNTDVDVFSIYRWGDSSPSGYADCEFLGGGVLTYAPTLAEIKRLNSEWGIG